MEAKIKIRFPREKKFLIIGSGDPVKTFLLKLSRYFPVDSIYVLSNKECDRAWSSLEKEPIEKLCGRLGFKLDFVADINKPEIWDNIKAAGCNICFVLGSRWIFKKEFIDIFNGLIFNYHTSDLPKYQGGGGYRWQVMNREKNIFVAFHQITTKIDQGPILVKAGKKMRIAYPQDIFDGLHKFTADFFETFMKKLSKFKIIELKSQRQEEAFYFPLLDNEINGAIDLNWQADDIKLFIEAFSYPYKGAFLFYKDKKVFIKEAEVSKRKEKFHPFAAGLIINRSRDYLEIAGIGGNILLKKIFDAEGNGLLLSEFKLGDRFYMPNDELIKSRNYRPSNKDFILQVSDK